MKRQRRLLVSAAASVTFVALLCGCASTLSEAPAGSAIAVQSFTNSVGIEMVPVPAATFAMGAGDDLASRNWFYERPQHRVTISRPYRIARKEVTVGQFRQFRPGFRPNADANDAASGISWHDAQAFAEWLSRKEGRLYRLPTEAEWEFAAKRAQAGGADQPINLLDGPIEWTADWFGPYPVRQVTDPVGYASGALKAARGGRIGRNPNKSWDQWEIDYSRPEARLAFPPNFGPFEDAPASGGFHSIGIRLVEGPMPSGAPVVQEPAMHEVGIRRAGEIARLGSNPAKPYFRKRFYLPTPPDDSSNAAIDAAGIGQLYRPHHHSPGLTVMPNGDVLLATYTSYDEYEAGVSIIVSRLRFGADQWDMPAPFADIVGANDHAPLLMRDGETVRFFWGNPFLGGEEAGRHGFPFQFMETTDSGSTWSGVKYPKMIGRVGGHTRQPVNSAFRDRKNRLILSSDGGRDPRTGLGTGNESLAWASDDDGRTWYDTGGRTFGRHTVFLEGADGRLLGYGGKNTEIDGFMPLATSTDGGKTYVKSKTPFPSVRSNQRPSVIRLASGRLLMVSDYQRRNDGAAPIAGKRGAFAAVSDDDGRTWRFKDLPGVGLHEQPASADRMGGGTVGYSALAQAPNGVIHLVTSMTRPIIHLTFNEAWLDGPGGGASDEALMRSPERTVTARNSYDERYADGRLRGRWSGGTTSEGDFLLDGPQQWFYEDGRLQWEVSYRNGRKVGRERLYARDGSVISEWSHQPGGHSTWTRYWPHGERRSQSAWLGMFADGPARRWSPEGRLNFIGKFQAGALVGDMTKPDFPPD